MDDSGAVVWPASPAFLPGGIQSTPEKRATRLDFAKWLCSKENPLPARAVMNRLWKQFFGNGISATVSLEDRSSGNAGRMYMTGSNVTYAGVKTTDVVANVNVDARNALRQTLMKEVKKPGAELNQPVELRMLSLKGLEAALADARETSHVDFK